MPDTGTRRFLELPALPRRARLPAWTLALLVLASIAIAVAAPLAATPGEIASCLTPCHAGVGSAPDIATDFNGTDESAGHKMNWEPRIVADTSGATLAQGSKMPCTECHVAHGQPSTSIYAFSTARTGGTPIATVRELCEGCHRPSDSAEATPTVRGLLLHRLPTGVAQHADADATPCSTCHGGTAHAPFGHAGGVCEDCHGTDGSHAVHTSAGDPRGPGALACADCHDTGDYPGFASGTDSDGSGRIELDETDLCDGCHSPSGSYDGVDTTSTPGGGMSVGARTNWDAGVYETSSTLQTGKGRWCAGCHDLGGAVISATTAPPIAGDEAAPTTYGTGWGYYETGHGLATSTAYPDSGGLAPGAGIDCEACHDLGASHIDGLARTFDLSDGGDSTEYRQSYRLKLVDDLNPLMIPRQGILPFVTDDFRLCFQSGCHFAATYTDPNAMITSFRDETDFDYPAGQPIPVNEHAYHLELPGGGKWPADWGAADNSHPSCPSCHNVHGSTQLAMVRDGTLIGATPGMVVYYNDGVEALGPSATSRADSTATAFIPASTFNLCTSCHAAGGYYKWNRTPPTTQQAPLLGWTGEADYVSDGVHEDTATAGARFVFRVDYADVNGDPPKRIQVWVDEDDDGSYAEAEKYTMYATDPTDVDFTGGNRYRRTLVLDKARAESASTLDYRFYADDGKDPAGGAPTFGKTLGVLNRVPTLAWTGEPEYAGDGVSPDSAASGDTFTFRVTYTDLDGEAPSAIAVWADEDGDSTVDAGETTPLARDQAAPGADGDHRNGEVYVADVVLDDATGPLAYRFAASDGFDSAVGTPTANATVQVTAGTTAPTLAWTGEPGFVADGVDPDRDAEGADFRFEVTYTDADDDAPGFAKVWIDGSDTDLVEVDPSDTVYSDGKRYRADVTLSTPGTLSYSFTAEDSTGRAATGPPTASKTVEVVDARQVPTEYGTIQAAINAANPGDYVIVAPGTYPENISFIGKAITVRAAGGAGVTTIEGTASANAAVVTFATSETSASVLSGFEIDNQNGPSSATRGVAIGAASPTIEDCVIGGNSLVYNYDGAGIRIDGGGATIRDTIIGGSVGNANAAGELGGGIEWRNSPGDDLTLIRTEVSYGSCYYGGGISFSNNAGTLVLIDSTVSDNSSIRHGGGLYGPDQDIVMTGGSVADNAAGWDGAGFYLWGAGGLTIDGGTVDGNSGRYAGGIYTNYTGGTLALDDATISGNNTIASGFGGGVYCLGTYAASITGCDVVGNNASQGWDGGGLYLSGDYQTVAIEDTVISGSSGRWGVGIHFSATNAATLTVSGCEISDNTGFAQGVGMWITGGSGGGNVVRAIVDDTLITGNHATTNSGGGVGIITGSLEATFTNCTITGNTAISSYGGGMQVAGANTAVDIVNCTFSGNIAQHGGAISYSDDGSADLSITNSILWGDRQFSNSGPEIRDQSLSADITYTNIRQKGYSGNGNMSVDPMFLDPRDFSDAPTSEGDYHLHPDSPLVDKGTATGAPATDIDGDSRPQGNGIDMGSDEIGSSAEIPMGAMKVGRTAATLLAPSTHQLPAATDTPWEGTTAETLDAGSGFVAMAAGALDGGPSATALGGALEKPLGDGRAPLAPLPAMALGSLSLLALARRFLGRRG